jgi:hypothetical protein
MKAAIVETELQSSDQMADVVMAGTGETTVSRMPERFGDQHTHPRAAYSENPRLRPMGAHPDPPP